MKLLSLSKRKKLTLSNINKIHTSTCMYFNIVMIHIGRMINRTRIYNSFILHVSQYRKKISVVHVLQRHYTAFPLLTEWIRELKNNSKMIKATDDSLSIFLILWAGSDNMLQESQDWLSKWRLWDVSFLFTRSSLLHVVMILRL